MLMQKNLASLTHSSARRAHVPLASRCAAPLRVPAVRCMATSAALDKASETLRIPTAKISPVAQAVLLSAFQSYAVATPSVLAVVKNVVGKKFPEGTKMWHDHYAFRTFGVPGLGVRSLAEPLMQLGYEQQADGFEFPNKKLVANWFAPKDKNAYEQGLPRIFVSEIQIEKLSSEAQAVIKKYTSHVKDLNPALALGALLTRTLPWPTPTLADYELLLKESEYAAWTLVHGYCLNHSTVSVHRLGREASFGVTEFTAMVQAEGLPLNQEGGLIKVSPDGMLLQSSTVSDKLSFKFACGAVKDVAGSYIEFAERRPLKMVSPLTELDRRDGFEAGNADKIFMSTNVAK